MADILDRIIHKLPERNGHVEALKVMTVRMPASLYAILKEEADARGTSANRLAVAKLAIQANVLDKVAEEMQTE